MIQKLQREKKGVRASLNTAVLLGVILALLPFLPFLERGKNSEVKLYKKVFSTKQAHAEGMLTSTTGTSTSSTSGACSL